MTIVFKCGHVCVRLLYDEGAFGYFLNVGCNV